MPITIKSSINVKPPFKKMLREKAKMKSLFKLIFIGLLLLDILYASYFKAIKVLLKFSIKIKLP